MSQISKTSTGGGGGGGIETINGDVGSITGPVVTVYANNAANNSGSTVQFVNSGTVSTLNLSDTLVHNTFLGYLTGNSTNTSAENVGLGVAALNLVTTSGQNVAIGNGALTSLTGPVGGAGSNVAIGNSTATSLLTGTDNIVIGSASGSAYTSNESGNILLENPGVVGESNVTRIGIQSGGGAQTSCFVAGISGVTAVGSPVAISSTGQLSNLGFGTSAQILTSNGAGISPTWQAPSGGILVASGNITNSEIKNLHGTPKQIIAAPGSGKVIQVLHGVMTMNYGGNNAFVNGGAGAISIFYSTTQSILQLLNNAQIVATSSQIIMGAAPSLVAVAYTAITNLAVNIYSVSATEISGNAANDNTMSYNVVYRIITIP